MSIEWNLIWGVGVILIGIYWIIKRSVPIGIEGRKPSFLAKGKWAVVLGIIAILVGLFVAIDVPKQIAIDKCLDNRGSFNYETNVCEFNKP